jgi:hypothetical protein
MGAMSSREVEALCALYFAGASEQEVAALHRMPLADVRELRRRGFHALLLYLRRLAEDAPTLQ